MTFTQKQRDEYFKFLCTETEGKIGKQYTTKFKPLMEYFLTLTPEEFYTYYVQHKNQYRYVSYNSHTAENELRWLGSSFEDEEQQDKDIMRQIKEIYKYAGEDCKENSEPSWKFYMLLSLYVRP